MCGFIILCVDITICKAVIQYNFNKLLIHISMIIICCIGVFGRENTGIFHAANDIDIMKSTCQIDFATVNNQPTLINQPMTSPISIATHNLSMNTIFPVTTESAIFNVTTESAIFNGTTESTTESMPLAILVVSVTCGILGLCIIFTCIVGMIVIKKKRRNDNIRKGIFIGESLTSVLNRYIIYPLII